MANFWDKITSPFKKAGNAVKKTIGDFFAPAPDKVRVRDFAREVPGAAEAVGKKVLEFGKDILRAGPRAAASATLSVTGRKEAVPETTMEKFLWGDKPIKDIRGTGEDTIKDFGGGQSAQKKYGLPLGIALTALDIIPVVPEEKAGKQVVEELAKKYGDDIALAIVKKGGKKLAEQAIKEGGEKLVEKAGISLLKSEPVIETAIKDVKDLVPTISEEAGKMQITGLEQAAERLNKTGSAIIAENKANNLRLVVKDEGDFIKVGIDSGTGKLLPTDIKLPEKNFKTKEEAFDFIKSLSKTEDKTGTEKIIKSVEPAAYDEKDGRNLMEFENGALDLPELKKKLMIAEEGHEDSGLIDQIKNDVKQRESALVNPAKDEQAVDTLYHGTSAPDFNKFGTDLVYLAQNADEAKAFAENPIIGGGRGSGIARILDVKAPKGKIKDIDEVVQAAINDGDDLDAVIAKQAADAKKAGYNYLSFNHPSAVGDGDFKAIVSINPGELSIARVEKLPPNLTTKAEEALDAINESGKPAAEAGDKTAPEAFRADQMKPAPPGQPLAPMETPLADAQGSTPESALDAIDSMVGKTGKVQSVVDWFKGIPKKFTQAFSDRFAAMKDFEDNISKMAGKAIDIESSPYVAARMYAGRTGVIEAGLEDLQKILSPIRSERPDFTRFILARRAAERAERGFANPANVTGSQAMQALEELKSKVGEKTFQLFEQAEAGMQKWANETILKPAADAGIIAKNTYDSILSKNKHWVPFQVLDYLPDAKQADMMKTGSEIFSVSKQGIVKGLESTEKTIRDPFEAIIEKMSSAIGLIKRNEVAGKLIKLRDALPEGKDLIQPLEKTAKVPKGWGSISVFIDGKSTKWAVPEELSWAMHQMNNADAGILGNFLRFTSSAFRKGATNLYIPFSLSNAFRDAQMAVMTSKYGFNAADWVKGFYEGLKGSFGWDSKLLEEFNKSGGGFGGFLQSARDLGGIKNKLFEPSWWRKTKAVINPLDLISNFAEATELAPRLGVFNKALKKGASTLEAAFEARNSTIDFAKSGQEMRIINMWVPFVNARWQALLNTARVFKDRPIRSAAKASALIVIPGVTTYLWNTINYPDLYDDVPQWIKDTYFPIIVGEDKDKDGNRIPKMVMIPKGDVGQIFYNPLEYTMEYIRRGEPSNFTRLALEWMSQLSPIPFTRDGKVSTTQILSSALPPVIKTPMELATNQSFFTDAPIVPGSLANVSPEEQYNEKTPGLAVTVGRALGLSPMKLAYGVGGLLGGFGREIVDPSKILESSMTRFYRSTGGAKTNEAWNIRDEAVTGYNTARQQAKRAIQGNDVNAALKIIDNWNVAAEKMLPDILPYLAQDDPEEANKIRNSVTFSPQDISKLQKTVYNEAIGKSQRLGTKPQLNSTDESSSLKKMRESLKR